MTIHPPPSTAEIALRPPGQVMRLARLGALHQCRLSFMRQLTRRMARESWRFSRHLWEVDSQGVGRAVYVADGPQRSYALVAFAHDLPDDMRSDRVIATAWDATFALFDGIPSRQDLDRLQAQVPLQEAGRVSGRELTLSRANRSARLWRHVVDALSEGRQPDADVLRNTGYLMRTTAVYGSGKFGAADWQMISHRPEMQAPFQAEMLTVYLIRAFALDLVNHAAETQGGAAATTLDDTLARELGVGNSTGLGMAPYLINHPVLLNNWITARETAIARVRAVPRASLAEHQCFSTCLAGALRTAQAWHSADATQAAATQTLREDLAAVTHWQASGGLDAPQPWDALTLWAAQHLSLEGQEAVASLMLEPYPQLVDDLAATMSDPSSGSGTFDAGQAVGPMRRLIAERFGWARGLDWSDPSAQARVWYVSAEKLEPRLGERAVEPVADYALPLDPARRAIEALQVLERFPAETPLWAVLDGEPDIRGALVRAQLTQDAPYGDICDNTVDQDLRPVDMLRAKLSFFGATRFDPRSDRWLRISMYAGAPYPHALGPETADHWVYPQDPAQ